MPGSLNFRSQLLLLSQLDTETNQVTAPVSTVHCTHSLSLI